MRRTNSGAWWTSARGDWGCRSRSDVPAAGDKRVMETFKVIVVIVDMRADSQLAAAGADHDSLLPECLGRLLGGHVVVLDGDDSGAILRALRAGHPPVGTRRQLAHRRRPVEDPLRHRLRTDLLEQAQARPQRLQTGHVERTPFPALGIG